MEEGVTSTDLIAFQEQRVRETEKNNRDKNNFERISGDDGGRGGYKLEEDLGGGSGGGGGGGGIINDVISNLLQRSTEAKQGEEDKGNQREEKLNDVETEEEGGGVGVGVGVGGGGGGGIIQTLVSHLPKNLLDDIAPPPDEASILIHSIVHD